MSSDLCFICKRKFVKHKLSQAKECFEKLLGDESET